MTVLSDQPTLPLERRFTTAGRHPYDDVEWERREVRLDHHADGSIAFHESGVEFPVAWSATAAAIVTQKYFRGQPGQPQREHSLRQMIDRVVGRIVEWGVADGYFADDEQADTFAAELIWLLLHQRAAFNSPVWFNIGVPGAPQQSSACFILSVDDTMDSILEWYVEEGKIFQGGSGAGVNLSRLRASDEPLSRGGTASGPVSFMRGADASAGTIKSGGTTRRAAKMVILDADHPDIEEFVWCKAREERKARVLRDAGFDVDLDGADAVSLQYQNANNSVRLTDEFMAAVEADGPWALTARTTGEVERVVPARSLFRQIAEAAWECADPGLQFDTTINRWHTTPTAGRITASNPCSEYLHLENSSCNLASINLLPFLSEDGTFDVEGFRHAARVVFVAQDILVGNADYPTEAIAQGSRAYRQLGLGYTNLGACLMAQGLAYDSAGGRAWAAAVTALMAGEASSTSARLAARLGPYDGFAADAANHRRVLGMHRGALDAIDARLAPAAMVDAARAAWDDAVDTAAVAGMRNAQTTVLAPTGTISFMMDCDTTGIEPELGLVKLKKLVGGGTITIVNQTVPRALRRLGYDDGQIQAISEHLLAGRSLDTAPGLAPEHVEVFAGSLGEGTAGISPEGHLAMMAAAQPFLSGGISKTVNLHQSASVDDVERLHLLAWRLGLKSVAIYRDGCKVGQPLSTGAAGAGGTGRPHEPVREKLPRQRRSRTISFRVADCHGYLTVGEYDDGRPGEIFITVAKQGSTLAGIMDAFAIAISHGLQYGVPLRAYVEAFTGMRFEPAGITDDPDLRLASSLVDYLFRRLALEYLPADERAELGVLSAGERSAPPLPGLETAGVDTVSGSDDGPTRPAPSAGGPLCHTCGDHMVRAGSCYACPSCGATSGCS
jgi:ribonucleoside-diphosphate reductase alpha chain